MNKRIGQDVSAIREQRPKSKRTIQREDQNLLYFILKTFITSETLFTLFTLFSSVFFSEVKIGGNFLRGNSKRFENSVENCRKRGLIKTIRGEWGGVRFSVLFPYLRTGDFPSIERTNVLSSVLCQESEKMETLARGKRENDSNLLENGGGYRER